MIRNPFFYRAADARTGNMAEERNFVGLFGVSALNLLTEKIQHIWELPLLLISAPGGGKSSLMRIFSPSALRFVHETAHIGKERKNLADHLTRLGALKNGRPYVLGVWLRLSDEYRGFDEFERENRHGLFCAMLNSRIILSALIGLCVLNDLLVSNNLSNISFKLKSGIKQDTVRIWKIWGAENAQDLYDKMAALEADLCELLDNPFWQGSPSKLSHSGLWSLDLLANLDVSVGNKQVEFHPLIMLDDFHELSSSQIQYLLSLLMSRQTTVPFWISARKQALGLEELLTGNIGRGVNRGRDYEVIDFENSKGEFKKRALEISKLRVQNVAAQIGGSSQAFVEFISDEREEIFLNNLDENVAKKIKKRILETAGIEIGRFEKLFSEVEQEYSIPHDLCRRLRMLEIFVHRELAKSQKSFPFWEVTEETFGKHESNKSIIEAADLFFAKEYNLPYYFGAHRLVTLSSFNIDQFLRLAGALFDEIMTAIRMGRDKDSFISPDRQHKILSKVAKNFLKEIPIMVPNGDIVIRLIRAIGDMCRHETYRPTASYPPGVTGTALTMSDFKILSEEAKKGTENHLDLYQAIESAIAHNILEPEPNYKCKNQEFLVLYLNRMLCIPFQLPLQKGGFREQKLSTILNWMNRGYSKNKKNLEQIELWM